MRTTILALLLLSALGTYAQNDPCVDMLLKQPGTWKQDKNPESTAPADLAMEKRITNAVHDMAHTQYSPMGLEANYGTGFVKESNLPYDSWFYRVLALQYNCTDGKIGKNHEGSSGMDVEFNRFEYGEIYDTTNDAQSSGFMNLRHGIPSEVKPGVWHFPEDKVSLGFGRSGKSDLWLLTYDGKLPWAFVTRQEFLVKRKRNLFILMEDSRKSTRETIAGMEKEKSLMEVQYKSEPDKMEHYLKTGYKPAMERFQKQLADNDKPYMATIADIDKQLQQPANELSRNAIVKQDPHNYLAFLFTEASDPMAKILIKPNTGYFKKSPRHVPQMIQVEMTWDPEDRVSVKFHEELFKAMDMDKIRRFVGSTTGGQ